MPFADLVPHGDPSVDAFILLMLAGFLIGGMGHVYKSSTAIIIGIGLIFLGTVALPLVIYFGGE